MRLTGWQRLWVVLATLWALVVVVMGVANWPQHAGELLEEDHTADRIWVDFDKTRPSPLVVIRETDTDGTKHVFFEGTDPTAAANQVRLARRRMRIQFVFVMFGVCLVPSLFLYALGWSVGWIRRGFR